MSAISKNAFKETECIFNFVAFEKLVVKHLLVIFQKGILLMPILYKYSPFLGKVSDFFVKWSALEIPVDVIFQ